MTRPDLDSDFYHTQGQLLCSSFIRWTSKQLIADSSSTNNLIHTLYDAPFAVVSHGTEDDPVFNFGNKIALELFELDWEQFIQLPSRKSVATTNIKQREALMQQVTNNGHINNYSGVRISATGKHFKIEGATIWNIIDEDGNYHGQAAMFKNWSNFD